MLTIKSTKGRGLCCGLVVALLDSAGVFIKLFGVV